MILKHKIYFLFFLIYCRTKGIKVGSIVQEYSIDKKKWIKGCVTTINGDSITNNKLMKTIGVNWFEPMEGNDCRFYNWGAYYIEQFENRKIVCRPNSENRNFNLDHYD